MYISIGLTALCAGILQGVTGFGAGIVMMMVLPAFLPLNQAAGVSCAIAIILSFSMTMRYRRHISFKKVIFPAMLYLCASGGSICFSTLADQTAMKKVFGVFLLILSVYYLFFPVRTDRKLGFVASVLFIVISGICDGLFGIGGPLMVIYFLSQTGSKKEYLGSIQALFLINLIWGTAVRLCSGILTVEHFLYIGMGMVCILAGLGVANKIADRLDGKKMEKAIYLVIGISGLINIV